MSDFFTSQCASLSHPFLKSQGAYLLILCLGLDLEFVLACVDLVLAHFDLDCLSLYLSRSMCLGLFLGLYFSDFFSLFLDDLFLISNTGCLRDLVTFLATICSAPRLVNPATAHFFLIFIIFGKSFASTPLFS